MKRRSYESLDAENRELTDRNRRLDRGLNAVLNEQVAFTTTVLGSEVGHPDEAGHHIYRFLSSPSPGEDLVVWTYAGEDREPYSIVASVESTRRRALGTRDIAHSFFSVALARYHQHLAATPVGAQHDARPSLVPATPTRAPSHARPESQGGEATPDRSPSVQRTPRASI